MNEIILNSFVARVLAGQMEIEQIPLIYQEEVGRLVLERMQEQAEEDIEETEEDETEDIEDDAEETEETEEDNTGEEYN